MSKRSISTILTFLISFSLFTVSPVNLASAAGSAADTTDTASAAGVSGQTVTSAVYATNSTASSISLAWPDVPGSTGYNVYRSMSGNGSYTKVNASIVSSPGYTNTGLSANTRYFYKISTVSGDGESALSPEASALTQPDFGPNVYVFDPSTPASDIQTISNNIFTKQETNQFGPERYALLFKPGSYNANINVGFYTHVAGLGQMPDDVTINGGVTVDANWLPPHNATQNFWRSVENFSVSPSSGNMLWAVSQAASMRRMHIKGGLTLHDQGGWASGGYLADSKVDGTVVPGSQQQWFSRNSNWGSWNGSVWNTTILGSVNPPVENWPTNAYTVIDKTPIVREKPFLTFDGSKNKYQVFVPNLASNSNGTSWANGPAAGTAISIEDFFIANPATSVDSMNAALSQGKNLLLTPGVYHTSKPIQVTNPNTVVLGLGLATLHVDNGNAALTVADVDGVKIAGLLFEAGAVSSPFLMQIGPKGSANDHSANPTSLQDLYFRVGGDALAKADVCVEINSNNIIGDHFWVWRADHGTGAGWDSNLTTNGMVVNGNDVTFYGLFVEHFHQYQTVWNGERGRMYFYQTEMPYDVPNQESWMSNYGTANGYASYKVADSVTSHEAYGLGLYSFFRDADVKQERAIEIPDVPGVKIHHATTVYLSGMGEITHIANAMGSSVKKGSMRATLNDYVPRMTSGIQDVSATTITGKAPALPDVVAQNFSDNTTKLAHVAWDAIPASQYASTGSFAVQGTVEGSPIKAQANVTVVQSPNVPVTGISVTGAGNATAITTKSGTLQMSAAVTPANADNPTVAWTVTDVYGRATDKATISADGVLTSVKNGTVKVVATANDFSGVKGEATIAIGGQIVKSSAIAVTAAGNATMLAVKGGTLQMSAAVTPANTEDPFVTWSVVTADGTTTDKAAISPAGLLTSKKDGTVKVIATANDGSGVNGNQTISIIGQTVILYNGWSWVRESQGNWATDPADPNVMKLTTIEGSWGGSKPSDILLRDPGAADFTISTKLKFAASSNFEWAGLIVYQNDGNLISLGRSSLNQIRFSQVKNGVQTDKNYADPTAPGDIYLKIVKTGTVYSGYYSADGSTWTKVIDTFNYALTTPKVGIFTRKLNTAIPQKTGEFSNFSINGTVIPFWNPVTTVTVSGADGATAIKTKGGTLQMASEALPSTADNKSVLWSVVNTDGTATDKATIGADGLLTAVKNGQVKVVATAIDGSGVTGSETISISGQLPVRGVALDKHSLALAAGGAAQTLTAAVAPTNAENIAVTWTSSDESVATVDASGNVTPHKAGNVTITVTTVDGSFQDACAVIVVPNTVLNGTDSTMSGTTFDLTYSLGSSADSVNGIGASQDLTFTYDPAQVEFVSADVLKDGYTISDQQAAPGQVRIRLAAASAGSDKPVNVAGDWLKLHWKSKPLTQTVMAAIGLSQAAISFGDGVAAQLDGVTHKVQIVYEDRTALNTTIAQAQQTYDAAKEGHAVGTYPEGSKAGLLAAIQKAQATGDNVSATQGQVDQAANDLSAALQAFKDSLKTDNGHHYGNDKGDNH